MAVPMEVDAPFLHTPPPPPPRPSPSPLRRVRWADLVDLCPDSPPSPPKFGRPVPDAVEFVPVMPSPSPPPPPPPPAAKQPQLASPTLLRRLFGTVPPRRATRPAGSHPATQGARGRPVSYADAVRGHHINSANNLPRRSNEPVQMWRQQSHNIRTPSWSNPSARRAGRYVYRRKDEERANPTATTGRCINQLPEPGWTPVKERYWWRKKEKKGEHSWGHHWTGPRRHNALSSPSGLTTFKRATAGRCFVCLARGHWASSCQDLIRCFQCHRHGAQGGHLPIPSPKPAMATHPPQCAFHLGADQGWALGRQAAKAGEREADRERRHQALFLHPCPPRVHGRRDERRAADLRDREHRDRADEHPDFNKTFGRWYDDGDSRGQGHHGGDGRSHWPNAPRKERSRSPWRRDTGCSGHGGRTRAGATDDNDKNKTFNLHGTRRNKPTPRSPVSRLANSPGDEAWVDYPGNPCSKVPTAAARPTRPMVPVRRAFYRIKNDLRCTNAPSVQEVDDALLKFQKDMATLDEHDQHIEHGHEVNNDVPSAVVTVQEHQLPDPELHTETPEFQVQGNDRGTTTPPTPPQARPPSPTTPATETCTGIAELFTTPTQSILPQPGSASIKRGRRLKKQPVAIEGLRRSKRQACSRLKHLSAAERANHVLCRRLGYIKDDLTPTEQAVQEFVASFKGPMPQFIVAALTAVFHLDDDDVCRATSTLLKIGGPEAFEGLQETPDNV
ncbi:unnamed protein product [Urochloa humidicola]